MDEPDSLKAAVERSRRILAAAIKRRKPDAVVAMVSGGNDSALAFHLAKELGIKIDYIYHGITRTGIRQTTEFVREYYGNLGIPYIEGDAGSAYVDYLMRKGFFGRGEQAHRYAYHVLKAGPLRRALSRHIRKGRRGVNILLLNGARGEAESERRGRTKKHIWNPDYGGPKGNLWVNHVLHFTNEEKQAYLETRQVKINPVTKAICRSGECMCGTMQTAEERAEAAAVFPEWGKWLNDLETVVKKIWPWGWGEEMPKWVRAQKKGQGDLFQPLPMCTGCERRIEAWDSIEGRPPQ